MKCPDFVTSVCDKEQGPKNVCLSALGVKWERGWKMGTVKSVTAQNCTLLFLFLSFFSLEGNSEEIVGQQNVQYWSRTALWSTKSSVSSTTSVFDDFTLISPRFNQCLWHFSHSWKTFCCLTPGHASTDWSLFLPFFAAEPAISTGGRPLPPSFQYGFSSNLCKPA